MAKNDQQEAFERVLTSTLSRVTEFLKFAEAKNAALLTFASAWILASVNLLHGSAQMQPEWRTALTCALPLFAVAALVAIVSFLPKTLLSRFQAEERRTMIIPPLVPPSRTEMLFLSCIAYLQPITGRELRKVFGKDMSRDIVAALKRAGVIAAGPRSPEPGAPYTYVTTGKLLSVFGFASLRDLIWKSSKVPADNVQAQTYGPPRLQAVLAI